MGRRTVGEVRGRSEDPLGSLGRACGLSGVSRSGRRTLSKVWDGLGTLGEFRDGSGDSRRDPEWFVGASRWSGMGQGNRRAIRKGSEILGEVWDESEEPRGGSGRVRGPSGSSGTGMVTFKKVGTGRGTLG